MIGIAVIGCGQWGPNHVRNFSQLGETTVIGVADLSDERLGAIKSAHPGIETTKDYHDFLKRDGIDAVVGHRQGGARSRQGRAVRETAGAHRRRM
jgi:predicted dehydrogenase